MEKKEKIILANIGLLVTAAIWGGGFIAGKVALAEYSPFFILTIRFWGAAVLCGILFFPTLRSSNLPAVKYGMLLGAVQFAGLSLQLIGLDHTTAGKQSFLIATYVIFVPFLAWLILKKRPQKTDIAAAVLTIIGVGFMSLNESFSLSFGDSLSIGFALVFGLQIVLTGVFARNIHPLQLSFFQFLSSGTLAAIVTFFCGELPKGCSMPTLQSLLYLVIANTVIAFSIQNAAQKYASETTAAILLSLESVFGFFFSICFLHEKITARVVIGCVLIFCAVLLSKINSALHLAKKQVEKQQP